MYNRCWCYPADLDGSSPQSSHKDLKEEGRIWPGDSRSAWFWSTLDSDTWEKIVLGKFGWMFFFSSQKSLLIGWHNSSVPLLWTFEQTCAIFWRLQRAPVPKCVSWNNQMIKSPARRIWFLSNWCLVPANFISCLIKMIWSLLFSYQKFSLCFKDRNNITQARMFSFLKSACVSFSDVSLEHLWLWMTFSRAGSHCFALIFWCCFSLMAPHLNYEHISLGVLSWVCAPG